MIGRPPEPPEIRFFRYVKPDGDCWIWTGGKNHGYGTFWHGTGRINAHRWIYEYLIAPIPEGLQLDHYVCQVRACVNPWHLDPVTPRVNVLRSTAPSALAARRDLCIKGHPLIQTTTQRFCRICQREAQRRRRARRKEILS